MTQGQAGLKPKVFLTKTNILWLTSFLLLG